MKRKLLQAGILGIAIAPVLACATAQYQPPAASGSAEDSQREIDLSYDEVWERLVQFTAGTYFGIDNFEKESGLMTLSFGAEDPGRFVDGGRWKSTAPAFEGNYVDYLARYQNGQLTGRMNIVVTELASNRTRVRVNARYVFSSVVVDPYTSQRITNSWSFNTGTADTASVANAAMGTPPTRTLRPTHAAEREILDAIDSP